MNDQLDKAVALLARVVKAIAIKPEQLQFRVERGAGTAEVTITANPADTRRLVGSGASTLKQLALLFRLLARNSGMVVRLTELVRNDREEPAFVPYRPDPNWPREEVEKLLREIAEAVFEVPVVIETERHTDYSVKMYAIVQADLESNRALGLFDKIVNVLWIPIGTNRGMKVYAHAHDWKKNRTPVGPVASY